MSQHFLLSKAARSLSLARVARLSDEEAWNAFRLIRWTATEGAPVCPRCDCAAVYTYTTRKLWKCKACSHQFSVTSGTIFASRKLPIRDYLLAIAIFVNGAKGHSALQLSRDLDCQYKSAYVMAHKIREAMCADAKERTASGTVEVDGAYFGGHVRPENRKEDRRTAALLRTRPASVRSWSSCASAAGSRCHSWPRARPLRSTRSALACAPGSIIHADEAAGWDVLHQRYLTKRINHQEAYSDGEACTNQAESFFSRIRRAEIGIHHHIAGPYLAAYAGEMAWREDNRRVSNGEQYLMAANAALMHPVSRVWKGYWQR